jgi:hypothetical protein
MSESQPTLVFAVRGEGHSDLAHRLQQTVDELLPGWQGRVTHHSPEQDDGTAHRDAAEAIAFATLILAIPPSALASWTLAERMKLADRFGELWDALRKRLTEDERRRIELRMCGGRVRALDQARTEEILDALAEMAGDSHTQDPHRGDDR